MAHVFTGRSARPGGTATARGRAWALGLGLSVLAVGCGSGRPTATTASTVTGAAAATTASTVTGAAAATTASTVTGAAASTVASAVAGAAGATQPPAGIPAPAGSVNAREFAGRPGAARFRVLVGDVCLAVRARAPSALGPQASDAAVRSHVAAAAAVTRRTLTAFDRLQAPTTALAQLRPLSADSERLATLYADVLRAGAAPSRGYLAAIRLGEQRAAATAAAGGFPACGPATAAGRSVR